MPFREPTPNVVEKKENLPSVVAIYAKDITKTHESKFTEQGFGLSQKLASPETTTIYFWEGKLHPTKQERERKAEETEGYSSSSNSKESLELLAQNLAANLFGRKNPVLVRENKPSYELKFTPPQKDLGAQEGTIIRGLTPEEEKEFLQHYREAHRSLREQNPDPWAMTSEKLYGKVPDKDPTYDPEGYYSLLEINPRELGGLDDQQTEALIRTNFRRLIKKHHSDKGGTKIGSRPIQEAYDFLMDKEKRDSYGLSKT
ncbi:MAG: DnaJ domain-containing protein [Parcubacteria group bacterium]|jgi:hypothetical protein